MLAYQTDAHNSFKIAGSVKSIHITRDGRLDTATRLNFGGERMSDIVEEAKEYCVQARLDYEGHRILNKTVLEFMGFDNIESLMQEYKARKEWEAFQ